MKNKSTLNWIYRKVKGYIPQVVLISVLSSVVSLSGIALILVTRIILDNAQAGIIGDTLYKNIIILALILFLQLGVNAINGILKARVAGRMDIHLKSQIFERLISKDYSEITKMHSGEIVNRLCSDIDIVVKGVSAIIPSAISLIVKLIAGIAVVIILDPIIAAIVIVIGFIFPLFGRLLSKRYKYLHKEAQRTDGITRSFLQESFQNIIVIKTFLADNPIKRKLGGYLEDNFRIKIKRSTLGVTTHTGLYGSFTLGYYVVIIWGAVGIALGSVTYGTFLAFLQLVSQLRNPLQNISGLLPQYYSAIASAERLIELEEMKEEKIAPNIDTQALYDKLRFIGADSLCFGYDDHDIISHSDFKIEKGSICAVTGESGTGKSTLIRLLLSLYEPTDGRLYLQTDDGDINVSPGLRGLFAYVPQGDLMLSGTIRENIAFLAGDVTDEQVEKAARQAVIYDFISSLPQGFDTYIGERGLGLSEGQLQRIAIARALLLDSPILLLDECTSALDNETELALLRNLKAESGKTVILITHRPAALDICDRELNIKDGKITLRKIER